MHHQNATPDQIQRTLHDQFPLVQRVFDLAHDHDTRVWLVGGTVRDILLGQVTHDLDFAVEGDGLRLARYLANRLGGAYVALDPERGMGRVMLPPQRHGRGESSTGTHLDLASLRGSDLEHDLYDRDFTVNAIALECDDLRQLRLVDPLNGRGDLAQRTLRATSSSAFERDPVRTLRAIRLSSQLGFSIDSDTRVALQAAVPQLARISPERIRDEWFRIIMSPHAATPLRDTHHYGLLSLIAFPLSRLAGSGSGASGHRDGLTHAFDTVTAVERLWRALQSPIAATDVDLPEALYAMQTDLTGRYQAFICDERSYLGLLKCAALLHDVGKGELQASQTRTGDKAEHQLGSAAIAEQLSRQWRLSNAEAAMLSTTIRMRSRAAELAAQPLVTQRDIHRYYREAGTHGVDAAVVSLAERLATCEPTRRDQGWTRLADTVTVLLAAYLKHKDTVVDPPKLLTGTDLMREFGLRPGPEIGGALRQLREEQAAGEVVTRQEALAAVKAWLERGSESSRRTTD